MLPTSVLDRFAEKCPAGVMIRATLENLLRPERLDQIFNDVRTRQYNRTLLFSQMVAVMAGVATRTHQSVHTAYLAAKEELGVSSTALYGKLNRVEPPVTGALVRETAADAAGVIEALPRAQRVILKGMQVKILDGNHLAATEHRVSELRITREGPLAGQTLAGQTLAVLDAQTGLVSDLIPCEDGHAQERSLLPELLTHITKNTVIVADRNFCTSQFLFGLKDCGAAFIIRQHASTLHWQQVGKQRRLGRVASGILYEQELLLTYGEQTLTVRRITIKRDKPTESGETEIHILTNLPRSRANARKVAEIYRGRWTIEKAFQTLTDVLRCEVETLGYPQAALFSFAVAVVAYNTFAVVKAAMRSALGVKAVDEELSDYHLMHDVVITQTGMDIAVEPEAWERFQTMTPRQFATEILKLAGRVKLSRYPKKPRGPKKPQARKKSGQRNHHISTARVLAASRNP